MAAIYLTTKLCHFVNEKVFGKKRPFDLSFFNYLSLSLYSMTLPLLTQLVSYSPVSTNHWHSCSFPDFSIYGQAFKVEKMTLNSGPFGLLYYIISSSCCLCNSLEQSSHVWKISSKCLKKEAACSEKKSKNLSAIMVIKAV